jgi:hypothetical protein
MSKKKWIMLISIIIIGGLFITACGGSPSGSNNAPAVEKPAQQPPAQGTGVPNPPHQVDGAYTDCLSCHNTNSPVNRPSPHPERANCAVCHQPK